MTLVELLVSISMVAILAVSISFAIVVTLRQQPSTEGRLNISRWEQNLGTWLPTDLSAASAPATGVVPNDPGLTPSPCSTPATCSFGSNALLITWPSQSGSGIVTVSYRYGPASNGGSYELRRVECQPSGSCSSIRVLGDLDAPPDPWTAGVSPVPATVMSVSHSAADPSYDGDGDAEVTPATKWNFTVTVNALNSGDSDSETLTFTQQGTESVDLEPDSIEPPSFLAASSDCGGPVTLIVDESSSLPASAVTQIKTGVRSFVDAFEGTPTRLQIIGMGGSESRVLGGGSGDSGEWNKWWDLSEQGDVDALDPFIDSLNRSGGTNWEDSLYRAFYQRNGYPYENNPNLENPMPELVVFFTDGLPTRHRAEGSSYRSNDLVGPSQSPGDDTPYDAGPVLGPFSAVSPHGWYRANYLVDLQSDFTRVIGVGVGTQFGQSISLNDDTDLEEYLPDDPLHGDIWDWAAPAVGGHQRVPSREFLGDLITGHDPASYDGTLSGYQVAEYNGAWDPAEVKTADLLVTTDFSQFGSALVEIALAECGGTLTVQTRDTSVSPSVPAATNVTYAVDGVSTTTTSQVAKTGTFDIDLGSGTSETVDLVPVSSLATSGYTAQSWICKEKGVELDSSRYQRISADPMDGVRVTVTPNAAVACTMYVS